MAKRKFKIKRPGALTRKAEAAGQGICTFARMHYRDADLTGRQARFYINVLSHGACPAPKRKKNGRGLSGLGRFGVGDAFSKDASASIKGALKASQEAARGRCEDAVSYLTGAASAAGRAESNASGVAQRHITREVENRLGEALRHVRACARR